MSITTTDQGSGAFRTPTVRARKTLLFANDKSSGKTTAANAVLVSLLQRYPILMRNIEVREYERNPRLSTIFRKEDGLGNIVHRDARNAAAFDVSRELAYDPNATQWDDLLDDEPRPIFPDGSERVGVVVPVTTAGDSMESAIAAIDHVVSWGPRSQVFVVEQEYLGRFTDEMTDWKTYRDRLLAREADRVRVVRLEKLQVADIGGVVFQRIDRIVADAQATLRSDKLQGAALLRALRRARAEIAWGNRALEAMRPVADWFAT
jgi:hypothetical protein